MEVKAYLVLISIKGGYRVHSVHKTKSTADLYAECKSHDGDDSCVCEVGPDECNAISDILSDSQKEK